MPEALRTSWRLRASCGSPWNTPRRLEIHRPECGIALPIRSSHAFTILPATRHTVRASTFLTVNVILKCCFRSATSEITFLNYHKEIAPTGSGGHGFQCLKSEFAIVISSSTQTFKYGEETLPFDADNDEIVMPAGHLDADPTTPETTALELCRTLLNASPDRIELNGGCKSLMVIMCDARENKRKCNLIIITEDSKADTFVNVIVESSFKALTISRDTIWKFRLIARIISSIGQFSVGEFSRTRDYPLISRLPKLENYEMNLGRGSIEPGPSLNPFLTANFPEQNDAWVAGRRIIRLALYPDGWRLKLAYSDKVGIIKPRFIFMLCAPENFVMLSVYNHIPESSAFSILFLSLNKDYRPLWIIFDTQS